MLKYMRSPLNKVATPFLLGNGVKKKKPLKGNLSVTYVNCDVTYSQVQKVLVKMAAIFG